MVENRQGQQMVTFTASTIPIAILQIPELYQTMKISFEIEL